MNLCAALLVCVFFILGSMPTGAADIQPPAVALPATVHEMSPAQAEAYLAEHPETIIIDARMEDERRTRGHIRGSRPHDYLNEPKALEALGQLDKSKPCLVYCALGGRSQLLAIELHKLGFQHILLLKGGFNAWVAEGRAVEK